MTNVNVNIIAADDDDQMMLQMIVNEKHFKMMKRLLVINIDVNVTSYDN